jgi:hypothetical protein
LALALGVVVDDGATTPSRHPLVATIAIPQSAAARAHTAAELDATWSRWLQAPAESQRAHRYTLFRHGGDAPAALEAYLHASAKLCAMPGCDIETWLDAASALDHGRFGLRRIAFARWRAAAWRDDRAAAESWRQRYLALARLAHQPEGAELRQALGI